MLTIKTFIIINNYAAISFNLKVFLSFCLFYNSQEQIGGREKKFSRFTDELRTSRTEHRLVLNSSIIHGVVCSSSTCR